jgi:hypothetical protein
LTDIFSSQNFVTNYLNYTLAWVYLFLQKKGK